MIIIGKSKRNLRCLQAFMCHNDFNCQLSVSFYISLVPFQGAGAYSSDALIAANAYSGHMLRLAYYVTHAIASNSALELGLD